MSELNHESNNKSKKIYYFNVNSFYYCRSIFGIKILRYIQKLFKFYFMEFSNSINDNFVWILIPYYFSNLIQP